MAYRLLSGMLLALLDLMVVEPAFSPPRAYGVPPPVHVVGLRSVSQSEFDVVLVDPDEPTAAITMNTYTSPPDTVAFLRIWAATPGPVDQAIDEHVRWLVFLKDGRLFKVNLLKSATPAPVQLSSASGISARLCSLGSSTTFTHHAKADIVYEQPGADGDCSAADNQFSLVRLDMAPTDAPIPAQKPIGILVDGEGATIGWLALAPGNVLRRYDANFSNGQDVVTVAAEPSVLSRSPAVLLLVLDNVIRAYNVATGSLSGPLYTFSGSLTGLTVDESFAYFVDTDLATFGKILRIPLDGSASPTLLTTEPTGVVTLLLTATRLVYDAPGFASSTPGAPYSVKSIPRSGGAATPLLSDTVPTSLIITAGSKVYANSRPLLGAPRSIRVNDDGSGRVDLVDSEWVDYRLPPTTSPVPLTLRWPAKIVRVEDIIGVFSHGGAHVRVYETAGDTLVATLGTVPANHRWNLLSESGHPVGDKGVATLADLTGKLPLYFYDAAVNGSLVKVEVVPTPPVSLAAAVLPSSRSVQVGQAATAFATLINANPSVTATGCTIAPLTAVPVAFTFQTTDPTTNAVVGSANAPVDIPGGASQPFVMSLTPATQVAPTSVPFRFKCANSSAAPQVAGVNALLLSASANPVPDVIALVATLANDGIVSIPGASGTGFFAVATANVGATGDLIVSMGTGGVPLPLSLTVCPTNPVTGECLELSAGDCRSDHRVRRDADLRRVRPGARGGDLRSRHQPDRGPRHGRSGCDTRGDQRGGPHPVTRSPRASASSAVERGAHVGHREGR